MLERKLGIESLMVGDIVSPEGKYITSKGYHFSLGKGFRVKKINRKSITLAPLEFVNGKWVETDTVRISRQVTECYWTGRKIVEPLFGRDNERIKS